MRDNMASIKLDRESSSFILDCKTNTFKGLSFTILESTSRNFLSFEEGALRYESNPYYFKLIPQFNIDFEKNILIVLHEAVINYLKSNSQDTTKFQISIFDENEKQIAQTNFALNHLNKSSKSANITNFEFKGEQAGVAQFLDIAKIREEKGLDKELNFNTNSLLSTSNFNENNDKVNPFAQSFYENQNNDDADSDYEDDEDENNYQNQHEEPRPDDSFLHDDSLFQDLLFKPLSYNVSDLDGKRIFYSEYILYGVVGLAILLALLDFFNYFPWSSTITAIFVLIVAILAFLSIRTKIKEISRSGEDVSLLTRIFLERGELRCQNKGKNEVFRYVLNNESFEPNFVNIVNEYHNSLKKMQVRQNTIFCSGAKASDFFYALSVCPSAFRAKPVIPQIATILGILGTFIGLCLGLVGILIKFSSNPDMFSSIDAHEIQSLLQPFFTAFFTSIAGILFNILYTWVFIDYSRDLNEKLTKLDVTIDEIYQPGVENVEDLVETDEGKTVQDAINKMSKNFARHIDNMGNVIAAQLAVHIKSLNDNASEAIKRVLDELNDTMKKNINALTEEMRLSGDQFRNDVTKSGSDIRQSFENATQKITADFNDLIANVQKSQETLNGWNESTQKLLNEGIKLDELISSLDTKLKDSTQMVSDVKDLKPYVDAVLANNIQEYANDLNRLMETFKSGWMAVMQDTMKQLAQIVESSDR